MPKSKKWGAGFRVPIPRPGHAHGSARDYDRAAGKLLLRGLAGGAPEAPDSTHCVECAREGLYPQVYVAQSRALESREVSPGTHRLYRVTTLRYRCELGHGWEERVAYPASNPI